MIKRQGRIERIADVLREYRAARAAAQLLEAQLRSDPGAPKGNSGWEPRDGVAFAENLETTYLIRLYAEFESGLRDYWKNRLRRDTHPKMSQLIDALADQRFPQNTIVSVHDVREYRNSLVHASDGEQADDLTYFTMEQAKKHLCDYFGRLDADW